MTAGTCPWCWDFIQELDVVPCDGCHKIYHRDCLHYRVIDVEWDTTPKAYAFCIDCDE